MDFDFDRFVEVENVINAIFNGFPVHFDPDGPQMPSVPGLQNRSSTPSVAGSISSTASTFAPGNTSAFTNPSHASPAAMYIKRGGTDPPSWSSPAAYLADSRAMSTKTESKATVDMDHIERLLFPADLDGTSAIALSKRLGADGKRSPDGKRSHESAFGLDESSQQARKFMTVDDACRIPHKLVRDELVKLYFQYFHPFCPVIDEYDFMQIYDKIEDDEQLGKEIELPLFQAMMFVAFGHISAVRLLSTPFKSVYDGQRAYFEKASLLYRINYTQDQLTLTKVALLLTFWSPFDSEYQVNNYWVDRAFIHARAMKLWEPLEEEPPGSRRQIVWWCCLLRDRMISFALRRSYRIQEIKSNWPLVDMSEFGLEVMFPRFMDVKTKRTALASFIWLCELSDIIRDVAMFNENNSFDREWSGGLLDKASIVPQITQVSQFDNRLKNWKEGYLKITGEYIKSLPPRCCRLPNYVLIVCDSVLATLYMPYTHCPKGSIPIVQRFQKFGMGRLKAASSMIALHVRNLNSSAKIEEEITVGIIAWISLPMAVFKVLSEMDNKPPDEANTGRFADFVPLLSSLATRFHAAKVVSEMMGEPTNAIVERSFRLGLSRKQTQNLPADRDILKPAEVVDRSKNADEAEILNCLAKMVDLKFSTDGLK